MKKTAILLVIHVICVVGSSCAMSNKAFNDRERRAHEALNRLIDSAKKVEPDNFAQAINEMITIRSEYGYFTLWWTQGIMCGARTLFSDSIEADVIYTLVKSLKDEPQAAKTAFAMIEDLSRLGKSTTDLIKKNDVAICSNIALMEMCEQHYPKTFNYNACTRYAIRTANLPLLTYFFKKQPELAFQEEHFDTALEVAKFSILNAKKDDTHKCYPVHDVRTCYAILNVIQNFREQHEVFDFYAINRNIIRAPLEIVQWLVDKNYCPNNYKDGWSAIDRRIQSYDKFYVPCSEDVKIIELLQKGGGTCYQTDKNLGLLQAIEESIKTQFDRLDPNKEKHCESKTKKKDETLGSIKQIKDLVTK